MYKSIFLIFISSIIFILPASAQIPDKPEAWVSDYAGVLNKWQKQQLDNILRDLEQRTSNQIFIAIFERLPENTYLEDFTNRLFEKWHPGLKDKDNGLLIVIAVQDRKARIEVGYGLEDVITDLQARRVLQEKMIPYFKQGDYYQGLLAGLKILIPAAEGKYQIPVKGKRKDNDSEWGAFIIAMLIFLLLSRGLMRRRGMTISSRTGRSSVGPIFWGGFGGSSGGGGFSGGGFGGGFGGLSGGGGASGSW